VKAIRVVLAGVAVAVLAAACVPAPPPPPPPPPGPVPGDVGLPTDSPAVTENKTFVTTTLTAAPTNLDHPWDVAFTPDGATGLVTERGGRISSFDPVNGGAAKLLGTVADVQPVGESGLMGIAVDPTFPTSPYIYVCVSRGSNEIVRFTVDLDQAAGAGLSGQQTLLTGMPQASFHDGCRIRFQLSTSPAALWITMGDAGIGPAPQNLTSFAGKVLRTQVDNTGNTLLPYPGNPFELDANPTKALIYTYGHRNPQGLAFHPTTNTAYTSEHGPSINDEVNKLVSGGNYGWSPTNGSDYDQSKPMTNPFIPGTIPAIWRSGDTFTLAPSGIAFLQNLGGKDWKSWTGALAVTFLKDSKLRIMLLDGAGNVTGAYPTLPGKRLRSAVMGPDGSLYVTTDAGAPNDAIYKLTPS
jgi:glucose/arabinose dehydrogenase